MVLLLRREELQDPKDGLDKRTLSITRQWVPEVGLGSSHMRILLEAGLESKGSGHCRATEFVLVDSAG
jgi:hypothetical protein